MPVLNTTIEIEGTCPEDDSILHLEVHFTATRASRGARGPHGEQLEPDEESSIEIDQVILIPDAELSSVLLEEVIEHLATPNN
jgi:hypothetical protein